MHEHAPLSETRSPEDIRLALIAALNGFPDTVNVMTDEERRKLEAALQAVLDVRQRAGGAIVTETITTPAPVEAIKPLAEVIIPEIPVTLVEVQPDSPPERLETPQQRIDALVERMRGVMEKITNETDRAIFATVIQELQRIIPNIQNEIQTLRQRAKELKLAMPSIEGILEKSEPIRRLVRETHFRLFYASNVTEDQDLIRKPTSDGMKVMLQEALGIDVSFFADRRGELPMYGFNDYPDAPNYRMEESGGVRSAEHLTTDIPGIAVEYYRYNDNGDGDREPYRPAIAKTQVAIVVPFPILKDIIKSALEE